jgi:hypothetical protein
MKSFIDLSHLYYQVDIVSLKQIKTNITTNTNKRDATIDVDITEATPLFSNNKDFSSSFENNKENNNNNNNNNNNFKSYYSSEYIIKLICFKFGNIINRYATYDKMIRITCEKNKINQSILWQYLNELVLKSCINSFSFRSMTMEESLSIIISTTKK